MSAAKLSLTKQEFTLKPTSETFVADVIEFNRDLLGIPDRPVALLSVAEGSHLIKCLNEEVNELIDAVTEGQLFGTDETAVVQSVDALIDLMYFAVGGLWKMGLTQPMIVECMQVVHAANMTKVKAKVAKRHVEGAVDAGKPTDFVGPEAEIAQILSSK